MDDSFNLKTKCVPEKFQETCNCNKKYYSSSFQRIVSKQTDLKDLLS